MIKSSATGVLVWLERAGGERKKIHKQTQPIIDKVNSCFIGNLLYENKKLALIKKLLTGAPVVSIA